MKGHKTLLLSANVILFILIFINESFSQMIGSTGDQSPSPKEVKSASLNSDVFRGDVSLTTGTLNLTQNLGKVATPSGLCFSLDLNYSSTSQGGDNIPVIKGVPYGEGWDLSIPIITVSTKFYTKLDEATKNFINTQIIAFPDVVPSYYTQDDILKENQPYWFSPHISIPGIINERFVFKYFEKSTNTMVFMPAKFERFIEARLDNGVWTVSLWDGTDYYFNVVQTNSVSPSNQRMLHDSNGDLINNADEACTKPTDEVVSIYCSKIRNLNHPAGQAIVFKYNKYGKFNFLKEFHDETNQYPVDLSVYKEIYLKEVAAIDKETVLEEIFLDYSTVLDASTVMTGNPNDEIVTIEHNFLINATGAQDLLTIRQPGVERLDSLYNFKSIYKHGNFGGGNTINFEDGWKRYVHMKHPWVNCGTNFTYLNSSFNPYVGDYFGTCDLMFTYPAQFDPINNSLNSLTSSLSFNHSF